MYKYELKKNFGPSDAGELTAGPCDPQVGLVPPTCRRMACTGLLHHLLSETPTRGGTCLMAKLEHPSLGSVGGAGATTPTLTYGPACGNACGHSSFLSGLPLVPLILSLMLSPGAAEGSLHCPFPCSSSAFVSCMSP